MFFSKYLSNANLLHYCFKDWYNKQHTCAHIKCSNICTWYTFSLSFPSFYKSICHVLNIRGTHLGLGVTKKQTQTYTHTLHPFWLTWTPGLSARTWTTLLLLLQQPNGSHCCFCTGIDFIKLTSCVSVWGHNRCQKHTPNHRKGSSCLVCRKHVRVCACA